jgi:hypothetical protein
MSRAYEFSPEWRKRRAKVRKRQEDRWASKASAVKVTKMTPEELARFKSGPGAAR